MKPLAIAVAAVLLGAAAPVAAGAPPPLQPTCRAHADIKQLLTQQFAEMPTAIGLQANGDLIQVFAAKDGTTWTIVTTRPDGVSCIVALGQHWEALPVASHDPLA
jgi:hypothetical protein